MSLHLTYVRDTPSGPETARIALTNRKGEVTADGRAILDLIEDFADHDHKED